MKNKQLETLLIVIILLVVGLWIWNQAKGIEKQVTITTDKTEYKQRGEMKIMVENKKDIPIYIAMEAYTYSDKIYEMEIEKYENNSWYPTNYAFSNRIECSPGGQGPAIGCVEIKAGERLERVKPLTYVKCVGTFNFSTGEIPQMESEELLPNRYRLKINIGEKCWAETGEKAPTVIYSNEFTIKEV